jgi:CheY-like chemotaxis protein
LTIIDGRLTLIVTDVETHAGALPKTRLLSGTQALRMNQSNSTKSGTAENRESVNSSAMKRVLLVEDDRSVRRYLEVTLQRSGYEVITAGDGLEAMKLALSSAVDVVVTDAVMPNMTGQELARFFRSHAKLSKLPIVLLTGQENRETAAASKDLIDAFLYKPVKVDVLKSCLAKLLS